MKKNLGVFLSVFLGFLIGARFPAVYYVTRKHKELQQMPIAYSSQQYPRCLNQGLHRVKLTLPNRFCLSAEFASLDLMCYSSPQIATAPGAKTGLKCARRIAWRRKFCPHFL